MKSSRRYVNESIEHHQSHFQRPVYYDVFKEHWRQALFIFNKSLINDDDIKIVKNNLNQMVTLLLNELNTLNNYLSLKPVGQGSNINVKNRIEFEDKLTSSNYGPIWEYLFKNNIFEVVFLWSLSYPEYLYDLKNEQLKYFEALINQMQANDQTGLLLHAQIHRPLFSLLNHCSSHNSELIERQMISILNQLCVCICKNSDLLEIFFQQAKMATSPVNHENTSYSVHLAALSRNINAKFTKSNDGMQSSSRFFIFSLLIPYIHREGCLGE